MQKKTPLKAGLMILVLLIFAGTATAGQISLSFVPEEVDLSLENGIATFEGTDLAFSSKAGDPNIPWKRTRILLPPNTPLATISANAVITRTIPVAKGWGVSPAAPLATYMDGKVLVSWPAGSEIVDSRNILIYEEDNFYPCEPEGTLALVSAGGIRKWKFVDIYVPLFLFNPVSGEILKVTSCTLEVEYGDAMSPSSASPETSNFGADKIKDALNYDNMIGQYDQDLESSSALPQDEEMGTYAIITTDYIASNSDALSEFEAHKTNLGWNVLEVTESDWGGGTGDEASENIRSWLQNNYVTENITCVLLIGNPAPESGNVPMKMTYPRNNCDYYTDYKDCPTDLYYAELDGNWDLDGDGYYGEFDGEVESGDTGLGGAGTNAEIVVGRIPVYNDNISDLDSILRAIMDYQDTPVNSGAFLSRKKMLAAMVASNLADEDNGVSVTAGWPLGEELKEYVTDPEGDWKMFRIYEMVENIAGELPDPEREVISEYSVAENWFREEPGAAIWWTHGSDTVAWKLMDSDTTSLLPYSPRSVVFQVSCLNAYPEEPANLTYSMLKNTSVATIGATRVSWYFVGMEDFHTNNWGSNAGLGYQFMTHLVPGETAGEALGNAKQVPGGPFTAETWHNATDFNIYGDPSLSLEDAGIEAYSVSDPEPQDGAIDVERNITLTWTQENDPDINGWSINLGTSSNDLGSSETSLSNEDLAGQSISSRELEKETTYYWQVVSHTESMDYYGEVWSFTTRGTFKITTSQTDGVDPAEDLLLTWDSDLTGGITTVYFGTDQAAVEACDPSLRAGETNGTSYLIPASQLEENQTYFWKVVTTGSEGTAGSAESSVYSISTGEEGPPPASGGGGCNIGSSPATLLFMAPIFLLNGKK